MSYKLNFSYKNEKENSIKLLLLEHHLNNQNVKKKDKLSVYNSMYLKDKVDNDKVNDIIKTIFDTNSDNMLDSNGNNNFNGLIIPYNVERIRKKGIQNFYNVYQSKYNSGKANATGLGDFIRGSYFLMQFCEESNLLFNINILNHPISQFLEIYQNKQPSYYKNINKFDIVNFNPGILDDNILTNIHDYTINNVLRLYYINFYFYI